MQINHDNFLAKRIRSIIPLGLVFRIRNLIPIAFVFILLFDACKKTENFSPRNLNSPLVLTASDSVLVLGQANQYNPVISFSWTPGSNHGTSSSISYILQIDKKGNNFNTAVINTLGTNSYKLSYTTGVLNDSLLNHWKFSPGSAAQLEAKVIAIIGDSTHSPDTSRTLTITLTPYQPVSKTLYLIGDATPTGWNNNTAAALIPDPSIPGLFTLQSTLTPGNFKFITALGSFLPSYNKGVDSSHVVLRASNSDPDNQFAIGTTAVYSISVNIIADTINVHPLAQSPYSKLWILGDATPNGWNINSPNQMLTDPSNSFVFKYNEVLKAGEFKIPVATGNFGTDYYRPLSNDPPVTDTGVQFVAHGSSPADANDYKWKITTPGAYKIRLNLSVPSISITPFTPYTQLWIVGDATPAGWNINNPTPLTPDASNPYVFTYSGHLNAGEFKIPIATGNWGTSFFRPYKNHPAISDTTAQFVHSGAAPADTDDYKWVITTAGNYTITFNQLYETIHIQ